MDLHPQLIQFGGSLIAILVLAALAWALKLGGKPKLKDNSDVARAADEVESGFATERSSIARDGTAALARDQQGRIMVIKRHGNKFAGRILSSSGQSREVVDALIVDSGDTRFGEVRLSIDDAPYWADAINRL